MCALLLILALVSSPVAAQSYPSRPIRFIVGFTPGGGAGTNIANEYVAKSAPDGYTLLFNSSALAINLALYRNPPYALRDFAPVSIFSESVNLLVVSASLPARTLQELIALARER